jgi:hypothetical protein
MKETVTGTAREVGKWALIGGALTTAWMFIQRAVPAVLFESIKAAAIPGLQIGALVGAAIGLIDIVGKAVAPKKA